MVVQAIFNKGDAANFQTNQDRIDDCSFNIRILYILYFCVCVFWTKDVQNMEIKLTNYESFPFKITCVLFFLNGTFSLIPKLFWTGPFFLVKTKTFRFKSETFWTGSKTTFQYRMSLFDPISPKISTLDQTKNLFGPIEGTGIDFCLVLWVQNDFGPSK